MKVGGSLEFVREARLLFSLRVFSLISHRQTLFHAPLFQSSNKPNPGGGVWPHVRDALCHQFSLGKLKYECFVARDFVHGLVPPHADKEQ